MDKLAAILKEFKHYGMSASFHYADDTHSGDWMKGSSYEAKAMALFREHPELEAEMREIAKGFIWTLKSQPLRWTK